MAAQQYYHGDQSFPPPPPQVNLNGAPPPPYSAHPPPLNGSQQQPPKQQPPQTPGQNLRPQARPVPWQQAYSSYHHHPSQHYYAPYSPSTYPPQPAQAQGRPISPYSRRSPSPYTQRPHKPYPVYPQDHSLSDGDRPLSEHRRHRQHRHKRSVSREKPSHERRDGLLGAAGGGLIGDLILPGAGTLSGIIIGALKGRQYGKKKDDRRNS